MTASEVARRLPGAKKMGAGWIARCPAHRDQLPSLRLREGRGGRVLLHCFAGCDFRQVVAALGLRAEDLFPDNVRQSKSQSRDLGKRTNPAAANSVRLLEAFDSWRNQKIRTLSDRYRELARSADEAKQMLRKDPCNEDALDAVARFAHLEADLCRALDFLACACGSDWLDADSRVADVYLMWRGLTKA